MGNKLSTIKVGDEVRHDFSKNLGIVLEVRKDPKRYDYKVEWKNTGLAVNIADWYRREYLELLMDTSSERKE